MLLSQTYSISGWPSVPIASYSPSVRLPFIAVNFSCACLPHIISMISHLCLIRFVKVWKQNQVLPANEVLTDRAADFDLDDLEAHLQQQVNV